MQLFSILGLLAGFTMAQNSTLPAPVPPAVTLLYRMDVQLGQRFSLGPVPSGKERIVIPIIGGTFSGPKMSGMYSNSKQSEPQYQKRSIALSTVTQIKANRIASYRQDPQRRR